MKKVLSLLLAFAMLFAVVPMSALTASAETYEYYTYKVSDGKATIKDVDTSISGDITLPSTLGGYPVISIGDWAFEDCNNLESITLGNRVTSIGYQAFYGS